MTWRFTRRKIAHPGPLFNGHFVEVKALYVLSFDKIPCVNFISELDPTRAFTHVKKWHNREIRETHQHNYYEYADEKLLFNNTIFVLSQSRIIEVGNSYAQILFQPSHYGWAKTLVIGLAGFRKTPDPPVTRSRIVGFARRPDPEPAI
jgi:hypothetical protein